MDITTITMTSWAILIILFFLVLMDDYYCAKYRDEYRAAMREERKKMRER